MKSPRKPEIEHRTIKLLIGLIATLLPILTSQFALTPLESISASYYEVGWSSSIFIGFLFAIAAFLAAYNGKSAPEMILSRVTAIAALGVALFPCDCGRAAPGAGLHFIAAAIMFLVLIGFCRIFYLRAATKRAQDGNRAAGWRAWIYATCGGAIALAIGVLSVDFLFGNFISKELPRLVFYGESVALVAFGLAWLVASHIVLAADYERPDYHIATLLGRVAKRSQQEPAVLAEHQ